MKHSWRLFRALVLAALCYALFADAVCIAAYCSDNCDPCVSTVPCKCGQTCSHGASMVAAHRLDRYRFSSTRDAAGTEVETWDAILGLSILRATGKTEFGARELTQFSHDTLLVNAEVLHAVPEQCVLESVELFETCSIVTYVEQGPPATLSFCFDRAGALIEIDRARNAR